MAAYFEEPFVLQPVPLLYDDTVSTTSIQCVLFVNSEASTVGTYANASTFPIVYDSSSSLEEILEVMRRKFPGGAVTRIGFAFHNHGYLTKFCNDEEWFSDSDIVESQTVFSRNAKFMFDLLREFKVKNVDFLACKTLQKHYQWRKYYQLIQNQTGVIVGASEDDTGSMRYGGDWVMETTMEDIRDLYFTPEIENYANLLSVLSILYNFNVVGVGSNCFTITWKTPTVSVTEYKLSYNGGPDQTILESSVTKNTQYGYSGYTMKNIVGRPSSFTVSLKFTDVNGNLGWGTKSVSNISANAFNNPTVNAAVYDSPIISNSFTLIRFKASGAFSLPTTPTSQTIPTVAVILVGTGGNGGSTAGGAFGEAGGGSGGGVAFYPLYSSFSAAPPSSPATVTIGATKFGTLPSVSAGNNGPNGTNAIAIGGASISTTVNGVTLISGKGGNGQSGGATGLENYAASPGVTLVIPELETTYGFAGGGGGGTYTAGNGNPNINISQYIATSNTNRTLFGSGAGATQSSLATSGVSNTGGGGGGKGESAGGSFAGGSGVVYIYYSTYYFTVSDITSSSPTGEPIIPYILSRPIALSSITYPAAIGSVSLTGGSALSAVGGTAVAGTFTINSTVSSSVYNAGTYIDVSATFNPTDTAAYSSVATSVPSITVSKATPYVASRPTSATIEYPKKMSSVVITGGACTVSNGGASLPGTFTIHPDLSNSVFAVGTYQDVSAIFTPTSNTNYGTVVTTIPTLTVTQVATSQLQSLGVPAADLKTAGYTAADLKTAGFTATQQKSAGFTASEQKAAGFTASEQKAAGFTATEQKAAGFTASELKAASFSTAELKTAAFTPTELKAAGVSNAELYATFTTSTETKSVTKAVVSEVLASTAKAPLPLSDLVGYSFASSVQSVLAVKVTEVNSPVAVTRSEIQNGITAIYAVLDVSGGYVILPTWSSSVRVMNIGNELYRVYDSTGNTILDNNLQTGTTRTYDGITVVIGSVTATLATPPSVNFVLNALNSSIQLSTSSVIPSYSQSFTADATITLNTSVPASVFQETFFFRTDTDITTDASFVYYYVDTTKWPNKNTTLSARNGIVTSNGYVASDTGAKDFLRDLARQLFGTYLGADLFTNEDAVVADINTKFDTVANNIVSLLNSIDKTSGSFSGITIDGSGNKYLKDDTSTSNISRELMNELITAAPARFADIKTYYKYNGAVEDGFYKIPILAGDTITFKITISPATNQTSAVPTGPSVLTSRSYTVVLNVT